MTMIEDFEDRKYMYKILVLDRKVMKEIIFWTTRSLFI